MITFFEVFNMADVILDACLCLVDQVSVEWFLLYCKFSYGTFCPKQKVIDYLID